MQNNTFLKHLAQQFDKLHPFLPGSGQIALRHLRHQAIKDALSLGLPHPRQPTWKFALLQPLFDLSFQSYIHPSEKRSFETLSPYFLPNKDIHSLVFINGYYAPYLSHQVNRHDKVTVTNFSHLAKLQTDLLQELIEQSVNSKNIFPLLNGALSTDGALIIIPEDCQMETPIAIYHFLLNGDAAHQMIHPQTHIYVAKNARGIIIEKTISLTKTPALVNAQTFIKCEQGSQLTFYHAAMNSQHTYHFSNVHTSQYASSRLSIHDISLGATYSRLEREYELIGVHSQFNCFGLMLPFGYQHSDWVSRLHHHVPACQSQQMVKSVVGEDGHSTFFGNITVKKDAQKTKALMLNHNLLLSTNANAQTSPQFEIHADDVQCIHGASVGQLAEMTLFYLQSRGIDEIQAKKILIQAFINEVTESIQCDIIRQDVKAQIQPWLALMMAQDKQ